MYTGYRKHNTALSNSIYLAKSYVILHTKLFEFDNEELRFDQNDLFKRNRIA